MSVLSEQGVATTYYFVVDDLHPYLEEGTPVYLKQAVTKRGIVVRRLDDEVLVLLSPWEEWYRIDEVELADDD